MAVVSETSGLQAAVDAVAAELRPTQSRLRRIAAAAQEMRLAAQGHAASGSPRADDVAQGGSFAVTGFGVWEDDPLESAHSTVLLATYAIGQELEAIARSLNPVPLAYTDVVLMRSVTETAARAWWTLEPGLHPPDRVARHITDRLHGLHQVVLLLEGPRGIQAPPGAGATGPRHWLVREADLRAAAGLAGFLIKDAGKQHGYYVHGQKRLGSTALIDQLFETAGLGRAAYHDASAIAHGAAAGLLSRHVGRITDHEGQQLVQLGPAPDGLRLTPPPSPSSLHVR